MRDIGLYDIPCELTISHARDQLSSNDRVYLKHVSPEYLLTGGSFRISCKLRRRASKDRGGGLCKSRRIRLYERRSLMLAGFGATIYDIPLPF